MPVTCFRVSDAKSLVESYVGVTYAVCNLLPASTAGPFALVAETVLIDVDNAFSALLGHRGHGLRAVSELLQCSGTVSVHDDVHVGKQLLELGSPGVSLQVEVRGVFTHVAVYLEEWHVGQVRAGDLQYVGTVLGQDAGDGGACDDTAHLEYFDTLEDFLDAIAVGWEWGWGQVARELSDFPGRFLHVEFALEGM
jgi:hypothetical protein